MFFIAIVTFIAVYKFCAKMYSLKFVIRRRPVDLQRQIHSEP